jgi:anti-sigma factor RsiW
MRGCPDTDAIIAIGHALDWDVSDGLEHLRTCPDCRTRLATLRLTRAALVEAQPLDDAATARIIAAVRTEARRERTGLRSALGWAGVLEAALGGTAAVIVPVSSGVGIATPGAGVIAFVLGATAVVLGRRLRPEGAGTPSPGRA